MRSAVPCCPTGGSCSAGTSCRCSRSWGFDRPARHQPAGSDNDESDTMSGQPLAGVRVVELSDGIAGPYAGKLLADFVGPLKRSMIKRKLAKHASDSAA